MDTILSEATTLKIINAEIEEDLNLDEPVSVWVTDKDRIIPSTNITISTKLDSGVYKVGYSNDQGYYCKKTNIFKDELFLFTDDISNKILSEIDSFWNKKELYKEYNYIHKRGIFLEGYPGTGKSSIIAQLSKEIINKNGLVFIIDNMKELNYYADMLNFAIRKIEPERPIVTIIEDLNQFIYGMETILDFLDGGINLNHQVIIATSNNSEEIPESILRPSRFDLKVEIPLPGLQTRKEYFIFKNIKEDLAEEWARKTDKCSLADLKEIFISITILGYSFKEALSKIKSLNIGKNYLDKSKSSRKIFIEE